MTEPESKRDQREKELEFRLEELEDLVRRSGKLGVFALMTILAMIFVATAPVVMVFFSRSMVGGVCTGINAFLLVQLLFFVVTHERLRKRGRVIYEELSDELQWKISEDGSSKSDKIRKYKNPGLRTRVILRSFIFNTDLPLVGGHNANLLYFVVGTVLLFVTVYNDVRYF